MSDVLEDRLRRTFDAVAATSDEPAIDVTEPPRSRRPIALVAASLLVVLGLAATMFAVRSDDDPAPAAELPAWYQAIAPALPDGYSHVAVAQSGAERVLFLAVDPMSPGFVVFVVSRVPVEPNPDGTMTLAELDGGSPPDTTVRLPDGREVFVVCAVVTLDDIAAPCTDVPNPVSSEELRTLALALVHDLDVGALPPADPASEELLGAFPYEAAVQSVADVTVDFGESRAGWGYTSYQPAGSIDAPVMEVRYVRNLVPPLPDRRTAPSTLTIDGATLTWNTGADGAFNIVTTRAPLAPDTGSMILAALDAVPPAGDLPAWFRTLAPALPNGFTHIAVLHSGTQDVVLQAIDPTSPAVMLVFVSRVPVDPDPGGTMTLAELEAGSDPAAAIRLPDDRQVSVDCQVVTADVDAPTIPCDVLPDPVSAAELRTLALAVARELRTEDLPAPDPTSEGIVDELPIDDAIRSVTGLTVNDGVARPSWGLAAYASSADSDPVLQVRQVGLVVPALDPADVPVLAVELEGSTITTAALADGSFVMISSRPPLSSETGARIVAAARATFGTVSPPWDSTLQAALPDGFEHIAIVESSDDQLRLQAIDLTTAHVLDLRVDRTPSTERAVDAVALDDLRTADIDVDAELRVTLDDGRRVTVLCGTVVANTGCAEIAGRRPTGDELRRVAEALATIHVDALPSAVIGPPRNDHVDTAFRTLTGAHELEWEGDTNSLRVELNARTGPSDTTPRAEARSLSEIVPTPDPTTPRRSLMIGEAFVAWQVMPDGSLAAIATRDPVTEIDAIAFLDDVSASHRDDPRPTLPPLPTTVPPG